MRRQLRVFHLCVVTLLCASFFVHASDFAEFANLGFSEDSQYFMFSQYGHIEQDVFAELIVVDIPKNNYVPNGYSYRKFDGPFPIGQHGFGAMLTVLQDNTRLSDIYSIDHVQTGRIIYLSLVDNPKSEIRFRDFTNNTTYTVVLTQDARRGFNDAIRSSFSIELTANHPDEGQRFFMIGSPKRYRDKVEGYAIQQVIASPDERSLIFLIAVHERNGDGISIRYMVESVVIR